MHKHNILFIGLDTHTPCTEVAYIEDIRDAKTIHLGRILGNNAALSEENNCLNFVWHEQKPTVFLSA